MIYRNDVSESPVIATRNVHVPSMANGKLGFEEKVDQGYDDKRFSGSVPPKTLAIGRIPIKFGDTPMQTDIPDFSAWWDTISKTISSNTKELQWSYNENNYFTVNTSGTKAVVGFLPKEKITLGDWSFTSDNKFAVILVTSMNPDKNLADADKILVTTVARARNTGMEYNEAGDTLISEGTKPLLMEPVNVSLEFPNAGEYKIEVLDHDGLSTGKFVKTQANGVKINGSEYKSIWYIIEK
jgi:hypothetical protein